MSRTSFRISERSCIYLQSSTLGIYILTKLVWQKATVVEHEVRIKCSGKHTMLSCSLVKLFHCKLIKPFEYLKVQREKKTNQNFVQNKNKIKKDSKLI